MDTQTSQLSPLVMSVIYSLTQLFIPQGCTRTGMGPFGTGLCAEPVWCTAREREQQ